MHTCRRGSLGPRLSGSTGRCPVTPTPTWPHPPLPRRCPSQVEADVQEQTPLVCELLGLRTGLSAALRTVQKGPSIPGLCPSVQGFSLAVGTNAPPQAREQGAVWRASHPAVFQCVQQGIEETGRQDLRCARVTLGRSDLSRMPDSRTVGGHAWHRHRGLVSEGGDGRSRV